MPILALALASVVSLSAAGEKSPSQEKAQDKAAVVNGSVITQSDLEREMGGTRRRPSGMGRPQSGSQLLEIKRQTLERLIERELLYQESQKKGVKVDEVAVKEQLDTLKKRFPSDAEFKKWMSSMNLSATDVRLELMRRTAIQKLIDEELVQKITLSDKDIKTYYDGNPGFFEQPEQVRASHILVKVDPKAESSRKAEARKKIEDIQQKLKKGEDFAVLAKKSSECPSSAKGGDLGHFGRGQMVKAFEDVAFALELGKVSDIVETKFGYHLIKVVDKKLKGMMSYKDVKDRLGEYLKQEKVKEEVGLYVGKLKEEAKIEKFLEDEKK